MKFHLYRENSQMVQGDWRWKLHATNGRVVAESGDGCKSLGDMMKTLNSIFRSSGLRYAELQKAEKEARERYCLKAPR